MGIPEGLLIEDRAPHGAHVCLMYPDYLVLHAPHVYLV